MSRAFKRNVYISKKCALLSICRAWFTKTKKDVDLGIVMVFSSSSLGVNKVVDKDLSGDRDHHWRSAKLLQLDIETHINLK